MLVRVSLQFGTLALAFQDAVSRDGILMSSTRYWLFGIFLIALAGLACNAIGGTEPAPDKAPTVRLIQSLETVYYRVQGLTTEEIFHSVEAQGPELEGLGEGKFASGLTEDQSSFKWEFLSYDAHCDLDFVEISINLVVTLPEHLEAHRLSAEQAVRWQAFAEEVAVHEQQHVDIHLERMASFKSTLETFPTRFTDCKTLSSRIELAWEVERALDEQQQEAFHQSEEQRTQRLTRPIQNRVDINQEELSRLRRLSDDLSAQTRELRAAIAELEAQSRPLMQEMESIQARYPSLTLPSSIFETFQRLLNEWNTLNGQRNALVEQINLQVELRNQTIDTANELVEETNLLLEEIAWLS